MLEERNLMLRLVISITFLALVIDNGINKNKDSIAGV